ncbi:Metal-dependent hydrolase, endonuclease/exonuclease/phosphatase family [Fontimonas thermophila]|uniref:Metal-dependent hydrolase, endonuclease/exonuclease/phosphatase family n=1 Tax=Fontimonas thermophila TaxID=1076937 RepID=A0A1I2JTV3_9GAMM|nr:endonuclease/exonuclease/phosphatase family protein [Fontimonas thermophila]SFF58235.1 Metal-dependent hydrolase, endonuclease/exonuclease/phosphatase family [Fontimonas thermophila]
MDPVHAAESVADGLSAAPHRVRVLTLNIQVGMPTAHYGHYVTGAWRHVLPSRSARRNLDRIAELVAGFDVVALQEADAGSLRTAQINQIEYLARRAGFTHWHAAINRDLGPFAQHALGFLSHHPLHDVRHHPLPGRLPGRGVLEARLCAPGHAPLHVMVAHLSLGRSSRKRQLDYLASLADPHGGTVLMGDLNCEPSELVRHPALQRIGLRPVHSEPTYPSWRPVRSIDHVLVTPGVDAHTTHVLDTRLSDHLPVATEIRLRPL